MCVKTYPCKGLTATACKRMMLAAQVPCISTPSPTAPRRPPSCCANPLGTGTRLSNVRSLISRTGLRPRWTCSGVCSKANHWWRPPKRSVSIAPCHPATSPPHWARSAERDLVVALIAARILMPGSKLATARGLGDETAASSLGALLAPEDVDEDQLYAAMDWLIARQARMEDQLAQRQ